MKGLIPNRFLATPNGIIRGWADAAITMEVAAQCSTSSLRRVKIEPIWPTWLPMHKTRSTTQLQFSQNFSSVFSHYRQNKKFNDHFECIQSKYHGLQPQLSISRNFHFVWLGFQSAMTWSQLRGRVGENITTWVCHSKIFFISEVS